MQEVLRWLRANPLGPALTVVISALVFLLFVPQLTMMLIPAPHLLLLEVLLGSGMLPMLVHRIHFIPLRPLIAFWLGLYAIAFLRVPGRLWKADPLALSGHLTVWLLLGSIGLILLALFLRPRVPETTTPPSVA